MAIRFKADDLGYGMLLSGIETQSAAHRLRRLFASHGIDFTLSLRTEGDFQFVLYGVSQVTLESLIAGADVKLL
jgi:hypothetical protein